MFLRGFHKVAATLVTMTPEEYYDVVRRKDPYVGAVVGGAVGAGIGALKSRPGSRAAGALVGVAAGAGSGAVTGLVGGRALKNWQANRIRRMATDLNLKATPSRAHRNTEFGGSS